MPDVSAQITAAEAELVAARQEESRLRAEVSTRRMTVARLQRLAGRFGVEPKRRRPLSILGERETQRARV